MTSKFSSVGILLAVMIMLAPAGSLSASSSDVTSELMCPCGSCDEPLVSCECPESDQYRAQVTSMMRDGYTRDQIVQDFVGRFGTSVLADKALSSGIPGLNPDRRTLGFILLGSSILMMVFLSGRYLGARSSSRMRVTEKQGRGKEPQKRAKTARISKGKTKKFYDEMLDDYKYN